MAQGAFEVQVVDRHSGAERWVTVTAASREEAIDKVASLGEIVGEARLVSVDNPVKPPAEVPRRSLPTSLKWAIGMFIAVYLTSFLAMRQDALTLAEEDLMALSLCLFFPLMVADVLGLVMACLGHAWGAILGISLAAAGLLLTLGMYLVAGTADVNRLDVYSTLASIGYVVCLAKPESWEYYRLAASHRRSARA